MKRVQLKDFAVGCILITCAAWTAASPWGAKAIFDSGDGSSIAMVTGAPRGTRPPADESRRYIGISYEILQLSDDGEIRRVAKSKIFRGGDRVRFVVRTNRPGYLTVMNVGPSGNTHLLFSEYVDGFRPIEVPRNSNLRFVGEPGGERLLFMLSNEPNRLAAGLRGDPAASPPPYIPPQSVDAPAPAYSPMPMPPPMPMPMPTAPAQLSLPGDPLPGGGGGGAIPATTDAFPGQPPPMVASADGAKRLGGAKDIVLDSMQSSYTVLSPRDGYRPRPAGTKDLVVESNGGVNYGVLPVSAMADGGILTLDVLLRHN